MTELKWLKLSGLLHQCVYNRENVNCPFLDFRKMDNFQQFQLIDKIDESLGERMLSSCNSCRIQCKPIENRGLVIKNPHHFRVVG